MDNTPTNLSEAEGLNIDRACAYTGLSRRTLFNLMKTGQIKRRKLGNRTILLRSELRSLLYNLDVAV